MTCVSSEDSDQPGHPPSLISLHCPRRKMGQDLAIFRKHSEDSDQTGRMPRLSRVFAGRTSHFVGFDTLQLISVKIVRWFSYCFHNFMILTVATAKWNLLPNIPAMPPNTITPSVLGSITNELSIIYSCRSIAIMSVGYYVRQ